MTKYNATIMKVFDKMPDRMKKLPISEQGYPVPWFVSKVNGEWNFVGVDHRKPMEAIRRNICWVCGESLGSYKTFVIGPMCAVNRVTSEPPVHLTCGEFSVMACPFLSRPKMTRNYKTMPEEQRGNVPGIAIDRNPGVTLLWTCRSFHTFDPGVGTGRLISLGEPYGVSWWKEGRTATRAEVDESIETGLPILRQMAELDGPDAIAEMEQRIVEVQALLPEAVT